MFEHHDVGCRHMGLLFSYLFCVQRKIMVISQTAEADCPIFSVERSKLEKPSLSFQKWENLEALTSNSCGSFFLCLIDFYSV